MKLVVDADDFFEVNNGLDKLFRLKARFPGFKITLFTVLGFCSAEFLELMAKLDWIQLAFHTKTHQYVPAMGAAQFEEEVVEWVDCCAQYPNMVKGFKGPGWEVGTEGYEILKKQGFWVADHWPPANLNRGRPEMRVFLCPTTTTGGTLVHFHIQDVCGNGLATLFTPGHVALGSHHSVACLNLKPAEDQDVRMRFNKLFEPDAEFVFMDRMVMMKPSTEKLLKGKL